MENKLKKLKCTEADIEIIPQAKNPDKQLTYPKYTYFFNINTHETILKFYPDGNIPDVKNALANLIWNEEFKTGLRNFNINEWIMLNGRPIYPIHILSNGMPELEEIYDGNN